MRTSAFGPRCTWWLLEEEGFWAVNTPRLVGAVLAFWHAREWGLAAARVVSVLLSRVRAGADGAGAQAHLAGDSRVSPAPAVLAEGDTSADFSCGDSGCNAVDHDAVTSKDVPRGLTGLGVLDVEIDAA